MKYFIVIFATFCCAIFAEWHSWDTLPQEGQMIMTVNICPGVHYSKRQVLIVTQYHPRDPLITYHHTDGWWDAKPQDILKWFDEGSKVLYLPSPIDNNFINRMKDFIK